MLAIDSTSPKLNDPLIVSQPRQSSLCSQHISALGRGNTCEICAPRDHEFESQNKSTALPPTSVGLPPLTSMLDRLLTTSPPWPLPVMEAPVTVAWELLRTTMPWPWLPVMTRFELGAYKT